MSAQKALYIIDKEEKPHLINKANNDAFFYGYDKQYKSIIEDSRIALVDYPHFHPGFIFIEDQQMTITTFGDFDGDLSDSFEADIEIEIIPDRDIDDAYLIANWKRSEKDELKLICPLGDLRANKKKKEQFFLNVHKRFENSRYNLLFMAGGVQVVALEVRVPGFNLTPLEEYKKEQGEKLEDGGPQPISREVPKHVLHQKLVERNTANPGVQDDKAIPVEATISESGFVTKMKIDKEDVHDELLAEFALETVQLWTFKPLIKKGKPAESKITIPFAYNPAAVKK